MSNDDADIQDLEAAKSRALIENTAQSIFKHLQDLEDKKSLVMSRWVWELLQNARDAAPKGDDIRISLSVKSDKLTFRHSGASFTNEEISHLIYHGSTKHQGADSDSIGHFGSGFISTHLLSRRIRISGSMTTDRRFSFILDREAESPAALSRVMDRSWEEFKASLRSDVASVDGSFSTEYVYELTPDTVGAVDAGVTALGACAPYVMAFNPKLVHIEVETEVGAIRVSKSPARDVATGVRVVEVESSQSAGRTDKCWVALASEGDVSVAALLVAKDESLAIEVAPQVPRIFVAFPLYGTDDFAFPAVINSAAFKPAEERDGVFLGRSDRRGTRRTWP